MNFKAPFKWLFVGIGVAIIAIVSITIFLLKFNFPRQNSYTKLTGNSVENTQDSVAENKLQTEFPLRLDIPKINVDASVKSVGLTPDGEMDVSKDPTDLAWFNLGPRPGEIGSAVIAGHEGWKNGTQAVFDNLHKLQKGDKIYVEGEKGIVITFVVRELKIYNQYDNSADIFSSNDDKAHLNLITCDGIWNKELKSYSNRLVVLTDKE